VVDGGSDTRLATETAGMEALHLQARASQIYPDPRQRSSRPGSYPSGRGSNESAGAWECDTAIWGMNSLQEKRYAEEVGDSISL